MFFKENTCHIKSKSTGAGSIASTEDIVCAIKCLQSFLKAVQARENAGFILLCCIR